MNGFPSIYRCLSAICLFSVLCVSVGAADRSFLTEEERQWLDRHPVIRVAIDRHWPPYEFAGEDDEHDGITGDYFSLIEERLGIEFTYLPLDPWSETLAGMKSGRVDLIPAIMETPERAEYMCFTKTYLQAPIVIIVRKDVESALTLGEFDGMAVCGVEGYVVTDRIRKDYPAIALEVVPTVRTALRKVSFGMADAMVANAGVALY